MIDLSLFKTDDGSFTIYNNVVGECYHSKYGAINESQYVFIKNGIENCHSSAIKIFEAGFGTGLNALLSVIYANSFHIAISYVTIEKYPLEKELFDALKYDEHLPESKELFALLHKSPWNKEVKISEYFSIHKIKDDLNSHDFTSYNDYDLIFYDAFSPSKQPELWHPELFLKLSGILKSNGALVTYASSGMVKQALRQAGFKIFRLQGPPGKHHMIRATKE